MLCYGTGESRFQAEIDSRALLGAGARAQAGSRRRPQQGSGPRKQLTRSRYRAYSVPTSPRSGRYLTEEEGRIKLTSVPIHSWPNLAATRTGLLRSIHAVLFAMIIVWKAGCSCRRISRCKSAPEVGCPSRGRGVPSQRGRAPGSVECIGAPRSGCFKDHSGIRRQIRRWSLSRQ